MGESTAIGWTDHTFNPWWGCTRVSPGCQHCYAEAFAKRTGHQVWGANSPRRFFGDRHWREPVRWNDAAWRAGAPALVFCASMADVFEADVPELDEHRARLFDLIERTPWLRWQLLTKRPENVLEQLPDTWVADDLLELRWIGPPNVWIGCTVEDQKRADERLPELLAIPAPVRFISCEPLLGQVTLPPWALWCDCDSQTGVADGWWRCDSCHQIRREVDDPDGDTVVMSLDPARPDRRIRYDAVTRPKLIDWVIIGGESGAGHRPLDLENARSLVTQCERAGTPVFFKQVGGRTPTAGGDRLDGRSIKQFPAGIPRHHTGDDDR